MNVFLTTIGCRLNEAEAAGWTRALHAAGHAVVAEPAHADVVVLNSCAVTVEAARKSRKAVAALHRQNPRAQLALTGCYASLEPQTAASLAGVDVVIANTDKERMVELLETAMPGPSQQAHQATPPVRAARTRAFVKVQDGCRNRCTFCIVTVARGQERSRTIDDVVEEVDLLHANGAKDVILTGVHLGAYGSDRGTNLTTLVQQVLQRTDIARLRLSSLEPWDIPAGFWQLWRDQRLCPHLHLPLQSGSDRILRRMARQCDTQRFVQLVDEARSSIPDLVVTTDVIVGFPTETEADFQCTVELCQQIGFAHLHIFTYSPRAGTAAADMTGQLPHDVKKQRSVELHSVGQELRQRQFERFVGSKRAVLWEGPGEVQADGRRRWSGLTDNYLRAETAVSANTALENRITSARLAAIANDRFLAIPC